MRIAGNHSNYDALLALEQRQQLVEQRKQEKKAWQRAEQKRLREKSKKTSNVVAMRKQRAGKSVKQSEPIELLPARVAVEPIKSRSAVAPPHPQEPAAAAPPVEERHQLVIPKNQTLKRLW